MVWHSRTTSRWGAQKPAGMPENAHAPAIVSALNGRVELGSIELLRSHDFVDIRLAFDLWLA